jgi:uncharacterized protein YbjT (DUF2867 family)
MNTGTAGKHVVEELLKAEFSVVALLRKVRGILTLASKHLAYLILIL